VASVAPRFAPLGLAMAVMGVCVGTVRLPPFGHGLSLVIPVRHQTSQWQAAHQCEDTATGSASGTEDPRETVKGRSIHGGWLLSETTDGRRTMDPDTVPLCGWSLS